MSDERATDVLMNEYSHMWDYYNKIHESNQRLYENYFKAVSAFGAIFAIAAAILNSDSVTVELSYQMLFMGIASFLLLGLSLVGYNSIITFAREIGNSEIYLANMKDIRDYLWNSNHINTSELKPIHELRKFTHEKKPERVSDERLQIFVALNTFVLATAAFILAFSFIFSTALFLGAEATNHKLLSGTFLTSSVVGFGFMIAFYLVQRKKAYSARQTYVQLRMGTSTDPTADKVI